MSQEKNNATSGLFTILAVISIVLVMNWLYTLELVQFTGKIALFKKMAILQINGKDGGLPLRFIFVFVYTCLIFLSRLFKTFEKKKSDLVIAPIFAILFIIGYTDYYYYALFLFPLVTAGMLIYVPRFVKYFMGNKFETDKPIGVTETKKEDVSISLRTEEEGDMQIFNPALGIFLEGAAGSGKTVLILQMIEQFIKKLYCGVIYDYEGDLTEKSDDAALLSRVAYHYILNTDTKVKFAFLNFTDFRKTVRCNPVSKKYIKNYQNCRSFSETLMLNLNKEWASKRDFWAENTINAVAATVYYFNRNMPDEMNTLPYIIDFLLMDFDMAMRILSTDDEVAMYSDAIVAAIKKRAEGQIAGVQSSLQNYISPLRSESVYYIFNPNEKEEFSLNISDPENPYVLCVGNAPKEDGVFDGAIGAIMQIVKKQVNQLGKHPLVFYMMDELPTQYVDKIDKLPAEARKKGVCTVLAVQTLNQLERIYGELAANIVLENCGNVLCGRTSVKSAKRMVDVFGEYKKVDKTDNFNESGGGYSVRENYDKIIRTNDVTRQSAGHFTGLITGGEPPLFSTQFYYEKAKTTEIPDFNPHLKDKTDEEIDDILFENKVRIRKEIRQYMDEMNDMYDLDGSQARAAKEALRAEREAAKKKK